MEGREGGEDGKSEGEGGSEHVQRVRGGWREGKEGRRGGGEEGGREGLSMFKGAVGGDQVGLEVKVEAKVNKSQMLNWSLPPLSSMA
jgi:hypothetical protein